MFPQNRREFVALGVGMISTALIRNPQSHRPATAKIRVAVLGIGHAHAAGKTKVLLRVA